MAENPKAKDPSSTSEEYDIMAGRWALISALLGGSEAMRAAGRAFLPQHAAEQDRTYNERLACACLLNATAKTLERLVGKPFAEPIQLQDVPAQISELFDDIDLKGNRLDVFARDWFEGGLAKAFCHVVVEFPKKKEETRTLEQQRAANLRPYWVLVMPECLLDAREETVGGVRVLTHARIEESYDVVQGYTKVKRRRIRVFDKTAAGVEVKLMVPEENAAGEVKEWKQDGPPRVLGVPFIPIVTWYSAKREGLMLAKPRLQDLAELNKTHWQSSSDQRHILTVARFPILAASGAAAPAKKGGKDGAPNVTIGPNKILWMPDPQGRYYYVEHTGAAIEAGRKDLQDLEAQMDSYGGQFLKAKPGTQTATEKSIDTAEATSELAAMVQTFQDAMALAFWMTAQWLGMGEEVNAGVPKISTNWSTEPPTIEDRKETVLELQTGIIVESEARARLQQAGVATLSLEEYRAEKEATVSYTPGTAANPKQPPVQGSPADEQQPTEGAA